MSDNKVYTFIFSPPARLAWLTAKMYKVPADIVQVFYAAFNWLRQELTELCVRLCKIKLKRPLKES